MDQKDIEYFRKLLTSMLEEAKQKGDSTIEELTDSNEVFADPADRATAEPDRAFTRLDVLKVRDQELCRTGTVYYTRQPCGRYEEHESEEECGG